MTTQNTQKGCLITVTRFGSDADEMAIPLVLANTAQATGENVLLWLSMDAVELAKTGVADTIPAKSFPPLGELFTQYIENGGRIGVCPACGKTHGVVAENMIPKAEWMGAAALLEQTDGMRTLSF
jgi:predicted peroxiredoxin